MTFRDGTVAGIPARVARVSFTGELSYEILVDGRRGLELWTAVLAAGAPFGIAPYGTEAMHVLRAEKGFVIVGQDTDGTVTPDDLGMGWIVRKDDSDFIGRRSLRRADTFAAGPEAARRAAPGRAPPRGSPARRGGHGPDPDADDRPRHVVVPQPDARPADRARDGRARPRRATARPSTRRFRAARSPRRSCRPSSTTRREPAVTDEHLVAVDLAQVGLRADPRCLPLRAAEPNTRRHGTAGTSCGSVRTSGSSSARPGRRARSSESSRTALAGHHHSIVDVSANRIVFDLTDGLDLLSGGCGLDLDPSHWRPGMCAQTLFGQAQVILHQLDERTTRVFVRPSFAEYFVDRLGAAHRVS